MKFVVQLFIFITLSTLKNQKLEDVKYTSVRTIKIKRLNLVFIENI